MFDHSKITDLLTVDAQLAAFERVQAKIEQLAKDEARTRRAVMTAQRDWETAEADLARRLMDEAKADRDIQYLERAGKGYRFFGVKTTNRKRLEKANEAVTHNKRAVTLARKRRRAAERAFNDVCKTHEDAQKALNKAGSSREGVMKPAERLEEITTFRTQRLIAAQKISFENIAAAEKAELISNDQARRIRGLKMQADRELALAGNGARTPEQELERC